MFCENCGKRLIRGYQFCIECGTPVPPEQDEEEAQAAAEQPAEAPQSEEMPGVKPVSNEEGTLVFCPTCGMRMQMRTDVCEKCGMRLNGGGSGSGSSVPLVNSDPLGGDFGGISDSDIDQINQFVNNSGFDGSGVSYGGIGESAADIGGGNLNSEIEALNRQFANLNSTASEMPAISAPVREPEPVKPEPVQEDTSLGSLSRKVDDFSMEAGMPETQFMTESGLPVINGGEMAEPDVPVQLEQNYDDINIEVKSPAPVYSEPVVEEPVYSEPAVEEPVYSEPAVEEPVYSEPAVEEPVYSEPAVEEPVYSEPAVEEPVYSEPAVEEPVYSEPAVEEPVYSEPAVEEPVY
ncbi:MAG: zinc ribbon domain-containing protein, partial [Oscillospiraceae bacterium]